MLDDLVCFFIIGSASQPLPILLKLHLRHTFPDHPIQLHLLWNQSAVNGLCIIRHLRKNRFSNSL